MPLDDPIAWLRAQAPWLFAPELGVCIVGSQALAHASRAAGIAAPTPRDLDLAWMLDTPAGRQLLAEHDCLQPTTSGNLDRGTLALKIDGRRIEITTLRSGRPSESVAQRIRADLVARDMTIGALAVELATGTVHDPIGGLDDFRARRIVAVGDPADRVREHPVRWLRYYRKAHEWEFELDRRVRRLALRAGLLDTLPREAVGAELRAALLQCRSPGRFFLDLHEVALLQHLSPELALQFDGRPAGPQRWHPEVSQALHLILALAWAAAATAALDERDRLAVMVAVLCHDLGKGYTRPDELPGHPGHERLGLAPLDDLLQRFPGLADQRGRMLARCVCDQHVIVRHLRELRAGTLARHYDQHFRARDFPVHLFALAVAADSAGRLDHTESGEIVRQQVAADLQWLRATCERVDAAALRAAHPDLDRFRAALHEARARSIAEAMHDPRGPGT